MMCENQTTLQGLMHHTLVVSETENLTQVDLSESTDAINLNHRSRLGNFVAKQRWQNCVNVTIACSALKEGLENASTDHIEVGR